MMLYIPSIEAFEVLEIIPGHFLYGMSQWNNNMLMTFALVNMPHPPQELWVSHSYGNL